MVNVTLSAPRSPAPTTHPRPHYIPPLSIVTFNILAPCYKRLHHPNGTERPDREQDHPNMWHTRLDSILSLLLSLSPSPDIIALQEVWFHPPFLSRLKDALSPHFHLFFAQRSNGKRDGLALLIRRHSSTFSPTTPPKHVSTFRLATSDRIGLAVAVTLASGLPLLVVNAHLTFPHTTGLRRQRAQEADSLVDFITHHPCPQALLVGDFNGDCDSTACRRLSDAGFTNCFTRVNGAAQRPKTHFNHMKQQVFVDHVFLRIADDDATKRRCRMQEVTVCDVGAAVDGVGMRRLKGSKRSDAVLPVGIRDRVGGRTRRSEGSKWVLRPVRAVVYPEKLATEVWPTCFDMSDHRPVGVQLRCEMASI